MEEGSPHLTLQHSRGGGGVESAVSKNSLSHLRCVHSAVLWRRWRGKRKEQEKAVSFEVCGIIVDLQNASAVRRQHVDSHYEGRDATVSTPRAAAA